MTDQSKSVIIRLTSGQLRQIADQVDAYTALAAAGAECANHDQESGWDDYDEDTRYPCETLRAVAERYGLEGDGRG